MVSADRKISRDYKLPGMEAVQGKLIDKCFDSHINNQCEKLLNGEDIYVIHFQCDGATIKNTTLINILSGGGGVKLPVSFQNIVDCTCHTKGGHNKVAKFVAEILFDPINDLDPEKKLMDLNMFDGASVFRKAQHILKVVYPMLSYIVGEEHT